MTKAQVQNVKIIRTTNMRRGDEDMTTQRIENSDRGITLNKQLAWTVGCGLIGAGASVPQITGGWALAVSP